MSVNKIYKVVLFISAVVIFINLDSGHPQKNSPTGNNQLSINLKAQAVVVGPEIKLGDIGYIVLGDSAVRKRLSQIKIGIAPPPGESSEILLSYVKRCLIKEGFKKFVSVLRGPNVIRVTTAQNEIDKAFLREEYALNQFYLRKPG